MGQLGEHFKFMLVDYFFKHSASLCFLFKCSFNQCLLHLPSFLLQFCTKTGMMWRPFTVKSFALFRMAASKRRWMSWTPIQRCSAGKLFLATCFSSLVSSVLPQTCSKMLPCCHFSVRLCLRRRTASTDWTEWKILWRPSKVPPNRQTSWRSSTVKWYDCKPACFCFVGF